MRFVSSLSQHTDTAVALDEALEAFGDLKPDLVVIFASTDHGRRFWELVDGVRGAYPKATVWGCTASGVLAGGVEVESGSALVVVGAELPGVGLHPFHVSGSAQGAQSEAIAWDAHLGPAERGCLLLSDPFTFDLTAALPALHEALGGRPVVGGQVSGGRAPGGHVLVAGGEVYREGLVGLGLSGNVVMDGLVAQGCRPIGSPMFVTSCDGNRLLALDNVSPLEALRELHASLPSEEQALFRDALSLGVQMREQQEYQSGDFLIRNILQVDRDRQGLVVAYEPERFSVVQFHLRDANSAMADIVDLLARYGANPVGALMFTCVGRGEELFGVSGHDSGRFLSRFPEACLGGFFCNGEIGAVSGEPFLHGYTSVFATFRPAGEI